MSNEISIQVGGAVSSSAVVTRMVHATIVTETEKALQLSVSGQTVWVPRKALVSKGEYYQLAQWFRKGMNQYQWSWFDRHSSFNGIGA